MEELLLTHRFEHQNNQSTLNRLTDIGIPDVDEFINKLEQSNAIIAGSFPLQCLLNETYCDSDIDIFFYCFGVEGKWTPIHEYIYNGCGLSQGTFTACL